MPELPEVETVRAGLAGLLSGARIRRIQLMRRDLRSVIPAALPRRLAGQQILAIRRRAKYLLIDTAAGSMLCHLGMTGSWRLAPPGSERDHDHCYLHLDDGRRLAFRDPRRFGLLDLVEPDQEGTHPRLRELGPEPLDAQAFSLDHLARVCARRVTAIKGVIMDQRHVVGVGNIYAQEALFRSRILPQTSARTLPCPALALLIRQIRSVLTQAIRAGGSTISDYRQTGGGSGRYQERFLVYARAGLPCQRCATILLGATVAGRGTSWCPHCQR
jgi:formamidopyrimidine-DNA glycosylase